MIVAIAFAVIVIQISITVMPMIPIMVVIPIFPVLSAPMFKKIIVSHIFPFLRASGDHLSPDSIKNFKNQHTDDSCAKAHYQITAVKRGKMKQLLNKWNKQRQ